jgi:hypothetical protein
MFQTPLCLGSPDSPVCTGHYTVQCPVHRQPRAQIQFLCALSGGSPDSYCALSGVHRTGTVDCPVCPSRVLKNRPQPDRARGSVSLLCQRLRPQALWRFSSPAGDLTDGHHLRPPSPATSSLSFPPSVSRSSPHLLFFSLSVPCVKFAPSPLLLTPLPNL